MKLRQVIFAGVIGCTLCLSLPALSQTAKRIDKGARHTPLPVKSVAATPLVFEPPAASIYCSPKGKRVIPVRMAHAEGDNLENLSRPIIDTLRVSDSDGMPRQVVMEYCEKTKIKDKIYYKSAIFDYEEVRMFADKFVFNLKTEKLEAFGKKDLVRHGERLKVKRNFVVDFKDGKFLLDNTNGLIASVLGRGQIKSKSGKASFDFIIDMKKKEIDGSNRFVYVDQTTGLRLESKTSDCLFIKTTQEGVVTFSGSAEVTGARHLLKDNTVHYIVTVSDGRQSKHNDSFSINIPSLPYYHQSGPVTSGDIKVKGLAMNLAPRGLKARF